MTDQKLFLLSQGPHMLLPMTSSGNRKLYLHSSKKALVDDLTSVHIPDCRRMVTARQTEATNTKLDPRTLPKLGQTSLSATLTFQFTIRLGVRISRPTKPP